MSTESSSSSSSLYSSFSRRVKPLWAQLTDPLLWTGLFVFFGVVMLQANPSRYISCTALWINAHSMAVSKARIRYAEGLAEERERADKETEKPDVMDEVQEGKAFESGAGKGWHGQGKKGRDAWRWMTFSWVVGLLGILGHGVDVWLHFREGSLAEGWQKGCSVGMLGCASFLLLMEAGAQLYYGEKFMEIVF